ncbi:lysophospholipid acyltransferase family protein [Gemmatimonas aurantiaca]|uniref:lysophospholipid acyltransferase family protein n=1 Tax=Gemmatimonas aurantiaca TaxID=173480 RepID=UPI00301C1DFF
MTPSRPSFGQGAMQRITRAIARRIAQGVAWPFMRLLCRGVLTVLRVDVTVRGAWPREPVLMIANHLSWLDIVAVLARRRCTFVAKRDVQRWPVVGWCADALGVIWVDRERKRDLLRAIPALQETLQSGTSVLLFAEGTTGDGRALLPFKSGLVEAAVRARALVVPLAVTASASQGDLSALCWIGDETLMANLPRVGALRDIRITLHAAPALMPGPFARARAQRKQLTASARTAIAIRTFGGAIRRMSPETRHRAPQPQTFSSPPPTTS